MTKHEIAEKIKKIALDVTGAELVDGETLKACGLDSLSLVAVVAEIEERFHITFSDDDLQPEKLVALGDLVRITAKYL